MKSIYLDTSAINHLYDDPNASILTETIKTKTQPLISVFTFMEIASASDSKRRMGLLTLVRGIAGKCRPAAMPGDLLKRSLEAISIRASTIEISMGPKYDGVWIALSQPELIDDAAHKEIMERKRHEEKWYQDMYNQGRPEIQKVLTKLPPKEKHTLTFSRLIKYYYSSPDFVNLVYDLASPSGASVMIDNELVLRTIQDSEHWRFFLGGMAHGLYGRSVRISNFSKNKNPGSVDTQQSIYLATCDVFVTADQQQCRMLRLLTPLGHKRREVWNYSNFRSWLLTIREDC